MLRRQIRNKVKHIAAILSLSGCLLFCLIGQIAQASQSNDSTQTPIPIIQPKVLVLQRVVTMQPFPEATGSSAVIVHGCTYTGVNSGCLLPNWDSAPIMSCQDHTVSMKVVYNGKVLGKDDPSGIAGVDYFQLFPSITCGSLKTTYRLVNGDSLQKCAPPGITNECIEP
jgi:hypothetical protein